MINSTVVSRAAKVGIAFAAAGTMVLLSANSASAATSYSASGLSASVSGTTVTAKVTLKASVTTAASLSGICARSEAGRNIDFQLEPHRIGPAGTTVTASQKLTAGTYTYWGCAKVNGNWLNIGSTKTVTVPATPPPPTTTTPPPPTSDTPTPPSTPTPSTPTPSTPTSSPTTPASVTTTPVSSTPSITPPSISTSPTTTPPPAGPWSVQPIFSDTFDVAKPAGFAAPAKNDPKWSGYHFELGATGQDTSKRGYYRAEQASVHDGQMDVKLQTIDGKPRVFAPIPKLTNGWPYNGQLGGKYSVDVKISAPMPGYKQAFLLWPDSGSWDDGELDFPEGEYGSVNSNVTAFSHKVTNPGITNNCSSNMYRYSSSDTAANTTSKWGVDTWHTYTMEWVPSNGSADDAQNPGRWSTFVDGVKIHETTNPACIPSKSMHWVLQIETAIGGLAPAAATTGNVFIDNVRIWDYTG